LVTVPAVGAAEVSSTTLPLVIKDPEEPFARHWIIIVNSHIAVIEAPPPVLEVSVIADDFERTVPATPPHRTEKVRVGVAVVPYAPIAISLKHLPSCRKLAGIVTLGNKIVSVVELATAVPDAVAQVNVSFQNCLLIVFS
jgi:hypothetical protein